MSALPDVTTANFQTEVLGADKPVLVDFWASWCGPCKMLAPVVEKLSTQYTEKVRFVKLNTDENPDIAGKFGISGIPCLILIKDGKEIDRFVGFDPGPRISAMLNKHVSAA
jgi:thioredoxin 1